MPRKRYAAEQIINRLRTAEVGLAKGMTVNQVARKFGITDQTYYRWKKEYNEIRPHSSLGYRPPVPEYRESRTIEISQRN